ncbi:MAG: TetR family transcriptional regulator [Pseudomonadota bacterium]
MARQRAVQQRAEDTQKAILEAALLAFSTDGYEGVSLRTLETDAGVQRGRIAYHFENKETLWRRCVDLLVERLDAHFAPLAASFLDLDMASRLRASVAAFVRYSAENPELGRIIAREGGQPSWRLTYLVEQFQPRRNQWFEQVGGFELDPHLYYFIIGAGAFVFDVEFECREIFGVDPRDDAFIRDHAAMIADLLLAWVERRSGQENGRDPFLGR